MNVRTLFLLALAPACQKTTKTELMAQPPTQAVVSTASVKEEGECDKDDAKATAAPGPDGVLARGDKLKGEQAVTLAALFTTPEQFDQKTVATEGTVRQVCQRSGCWMELAADLDKGPGARITFKDYAFFMPKDSRGSHARLEGAVKLVELDEARAKHYASEGATVPRGKDGKAREIQIVATGVELTKDAGKTRVQ